MELKAPLLALLLAGCSVAGITGAEPAPPPVEAERLWAEAQACTGRTGDFRRLLWFRVPADSGGFLVDGHRIHGRWEQPHRLYLSSTYYEADWLVKHEMVHDLTQSGEHGQVFRDCGVW